MKISFNSNKELSLGVDMAEIGVGEGNGAGGGVAVHGSGKRGRGLEAFVQIKKKGGVRLAGISLGKYDSGRKKQNNTSPDCVKTDIAMGSLTTLM